MPFCLKTKIFVYIVLKLFGIRKRKLFYAIEWALEKWQKTIPIELDSIDYLQSLNTISKKKTYIM